MSAAEATPARDQTTSSAIGSWLLTLTRVVLGGIFLFAAYGKLRNPHAFAGSVGAFKLLHESILIEVGLLFIWHEIVCGLLLVLGLWARAAALVTGAMVLAFIIAMITALARGLDIECGCFGNLLKSGVGWGSILRTSVFLLMALAVILWGPGRLSLTSAGKR